jgi:hypothetical protein
MAKSSNLTTEAREGYEGTVNAIYSSPVWYAQTLGKFFRETGRPQPNDVRMSRGASMHASGMLFKYDDRAGWARVR